MAEIPLTRDRPQQRDSEINIDKFVIISSIHPAGSTIIKGRGVKEIIMTNIPDRLLLTRKIKTVDVTSVPLIHKGTNKSFIYSAVSLTNKFQ